MLAGTSWPPVIEYSWVIFHGINHQGNQILVKSEIATAGIQGGGSLMSKIPLRCMPY